MPDEKKPQDDDAELDKAQIVWHGQAKIEYGKWEVPKGAAPKPAPKPKG